MSERKSKNLGDWLSYPVEYGRTLFILPSIGAGSEGDVFAASGAFGQWIFVVPSKDLVVVATGNAIVRGDFAQPIKLLYEVIIPAAH